MVKFFFAVMASLILHSPVQANSKLNTSSKSVVQHQLQQLIKVADSEALLSLLKSLPQSEIQQSFTLENPFVLAITTTESCSAELLDVLAAAKAPVEGTAEGNALHYVGYFRSIDDNLNCLNKLLAMGLNINQQDQDGYTPLVKLLYSHSEHTAELLSYMLQKGANPLIRSHSGMDFLHHALALQLLYSEQLNFLKEDDPLFSKTAKMVTTTQLARSLYAEFYVGQQKNKLDIGSHR